MEHHESMPQKKRRKLRIARKKTYYMMNTEWYCKLCDNGHNYSLAGKHSHLKTKMHLISELKNKIVEYENKFNSSEYEKSD